MLSSIILFSPSFSKKKNKKMATKSKKDNLFFFQSNAHLCASNTRQDFHLVYSFWENEEEKP